MDGWDWEGIGAEWRCILLGCILRRREGWDGTDGKLGIGERRECIDELDDDAADGWVKGVALVRPILYIWSINGGFT